MLPQTRYLDAGPALPEASMQAALAPAGAYAQFGQTIQAIGEEGLKIANRVRQAEEGGKMSQFFADIDLEAGRFSNSLLSRSDPDKWPEEWKQKVSEFRDKSQKLGLSPVGGQELAAKIQDWSTQRTIRMEALSAGRIVDESHARIQNNFKFAAARGDEDGVNRQLDAMRSAGLPESSIQAAEFEGKNLMARQALSESAATNPTALLADLEDPEYLNWPGNEQLTVADVEYGKQQARQQERITYTAAGDKFQDLAATGEIRSIEDVDKVFGSTIPPRLRETFAANLADRWKDSEIARRATPEYQAMTVADVEVGLSDLPLEVGQFPQKLVELELKANTLPSGPARTRLMERISAVKDGNEAPINSAIDAATDSFVAAYKGKHFGDTSKKTVSSLLDDGYLRNKKNLTDDGYSPAQVEMIQGKSVDKDALKEAGFDKAYTEKLIGKVKDGKVTEADRLELFRAFRQTKSYGKSNLTDYKASIANALARGETTVDSPIDSEESFNAHLKLGQARLEFEKALQAHPDKSEDSTWINTERNRILDKAVVQGATSLFTAPPIAPRAVPVQPEEDSSFSGVLPPKGPAPKVAPFIQK